MQSKVRPDGLRDRCPDHPFRSKVITEAFGPLRVAHDLHLNAVVSASVMYVSILLFTASRTASTVAMLKQNTRVLSPSRHVRKARSAVTATFGCSWLSPLTARWTSLR